MVSGACSNAPKKLSSRVPRQRAMTWGVVELVAEAVRGHIGVEK
jgi:hypothetical protein